MMEPATILESFALSLVEAGVDISPNSSLCNVLCMEIFFFPNYAALLLFDLCLLKVNGL